MEIKITQKNSYALIEILKDGKPTSPQNPIDESTELATVEMPEASGGKLAIVSGMPASALVMVALAYKNMYGAIAVANPRLGVALVVHSTTPAHPVGSSVPLA